ncbi:MAG: hypothetical protein CL610_16565 [Anaerolineaceae bacterium]|nr:hypothetical protein [Anaerolineaceae bacterium]
MPLIYGDPTIGKLIFTDNAVNQMHKYGLYRFQVVEALKRGFSVNPLIPGTLQRQHRPRAKFDVTVAFKTINNDGDTLGGVQIVSCWKRRIR